MIFYFNLNIRTKKPFNMISKCQLRRIVLEVLFESKMKLKRGQHLTDVDTDTDDKQKRHLYAKKHNYSDSDDKIKPKKQKSDQLLQLTPPNKLLTSIELCKQSDKLPKNSTTSQISSIITSNIGL